MKKRFSFLVVVILAVTVLSQGVAMGVPLLGNSVGSWEISAGGGFGVGPGNTAAGPLVEYNGDLYAAVANENGCQVWKNGTGGWTQVNGQPGFGDAENQAIARMAAFDGKLYAGTTNQVTGCEVWEYDGNTWNQANLDGFAKADNISVTAMEVFDGKLYVGVANLNMATVNSDGGEIFSYSGAAPWTEEMTGGFGDKKNMAVSSLEVYDGSLYAGTSRVNITVTPVSLTHVKVTLTSLGCELHKLVGASWNRIAGDGITDKRNAAVSAMEVFNGRLYIGTTNGDATATVEIATQEISEYTYDTDGLCIYTYDGTNVGEVVKGGFDSTDEFAVSEMATVDVSGSALLLTGVGIVEGAGKMMASDGSDWFPGAPDGFGNPDNRAIAGIAAFGGNTYVGTGNDKAGCEVWFGTPATERVGSFYLAEGYTGGSFQEYLCIGNASDTDTTASVTYMFTDGTTQQETCNVAANSRSTINVNEVVGPGREVSVRVDSDCASMVVERPMYFNYSDIYPGGHDAVAASSPGTEWYFAEGTTLPGFDCYITVLNPNTTDANLTFRYMVEGEGETVADDTVGANSRATFTVRDQVGGDKAGVSLKLESDRSVVAERPMYFNYSGLADNDWKGGHCVVGTNSPNDTWYFAEGTTRGGFEEWLCMQNSSDQPITVEATYVLGEGQGDPVTTSYEIPANERKTVSVNRELGADKDVSVTLTCDTSFIAERPLYFNYKPGDLNWPGGHDVLGANAAAGTWFFAEGYTGKNFQEWICIQNPGEETASITITYYPETGTPIIKQHTVNANTRETVNVNEDAGANLAISAKVTSDQPVICERPMYFLFNGWPGGHDVVGYAPGE